MRVQWVCSRERKIALYKRSSINQNNKRRRRFFYYYFFQMERIEGNCDSLHACYSATRKRRHLHITFRLCKRLKVDGLYIICCFGSHKFTWAPSIFSISVSLLFFQTKVLQRTRRRVCYSVRQKQAFSSSPGWCDGVAAVVVCYRFLVVVLSSTHQHFHH